MLVAFTLTVVLAGMNPEDVREALTSRLAENNKGNQLTNESAPVENWRPEKGTAVSGRAAELGTDNNSTLVSSGNSSAKPAFDHVGEQERTSTPSIQPRQFRVASAAIETSLGLHDQMAWNEDPATASTSNKPLQAPTAFQSGVEIDVPEPPETAKQDESASVSQDIARLREDLLKVSLTEARRELELLREFAEIEEAKRLQAEIDEVRQAIHDLRNRHEEITKGLTVAPEVAKPEIEPPKRTPNAKAVSDPVIEVTDGRTPQQFNFHFQNVEIRRVLEVICYHTRRKVVIDADIQGTFTGEFLDADPHQAFASLIHAHGFGLTSKGDYILVRKSRLR